MMRRTAICRRALDDPGMLLSPARGMRIHCNIRRPRSQYKRSPLAVTAVTRCCAGSPVQVAGSQLLADAERPEDQVEDVVGRGRSGNLIERSHSVVEIEQQHLVRDAC